MAELRLNEGAILMKIIICKGSANTPPRFWSWAVCAEEEFTEVMKEHGIVRSECTKYLTREQLDFLNN